MSFFKTFYSKFSIFELLMKNLKKKYFVIQTNSNKDFRERYKSELTVWLDENAEVGAIAPSIIPSGTVTRRAVHKLWMTSANPKVRLLNFS